MKNNKILLTPIQTEILVGSLLGDAHLQRQKLTHNPRLVFHHVDIQKFY